MDDGQQLLHLACISTSILPQDAATICRLMRPLAASWCAVLCGHLLEAVAGCGARSAEDITRFLKCTYAAAANMRRRVSWLGQCPKVVTSCKLHTHTTPLHNTHTPIPCGLRHVHPRCLCPAQEQRLPYEVVQQAKASLRWLGRPCWPRKRAGQAQGGGDRGEACCGWRPCRPWSSSSICACHACHAPPHRDVHHVPPQL